MPQDKPVIEVAGRDVDAAIAAGLARLDLPREAVEVEVLDEGRQGMFGLGARAARVRLTVTAKAKREPRPTPHPPTARPERPAPMAEVVPEEEAPLEVPPEAEAEEQEVITEEAKLRATREIMEGLLDAMGLDGAQVHVQRAAPGPSEDEVPPLVIDVSGGDTDILIGHDGEVLNALQYVTRLLVGRKMKGWVHVVVDIEGYKARRAERIRDLAHRMADQASDTNRTVILQPMPPHERRVVHVALYGDARVNTESIYEGDRRRVTIVPKE
ncbi:MAG: RNA-binding cell elongation regulator Jag/EloR [Anaerolineae bacterium]|jgi:spoIIIJ-associated protein